MKNSFTDRVYEIVGQVPKGKVISYGQIGRIMGNKAYRAIGQALAKNPYAPFVPCHRVIKSDGRLGGFGGKNDNDNKAKLLKSESVAIKDGKVGQEFFWELIPIDG